MKTYTVHEPSASFADRMEQAEAIVFVRDGFSWKAALVTPFWMIAHGMWLALLIYLAAVAALELALWAAGVAERFGGWVLLALHALIGFEAASIRRWHLARKDYRLVASVVGRNAETCERRFFDAWLQTQPFVTSAALAGRLADGPRRSFLPWRRRG